MKASSNDNHSPQNHHKKGVTFDTMEMLDRNSDCIDGLTSLVSNMKMTMHRKQSPYKPKYIRVGPEIKIGTDKFFHQEIGPLVEVEIKGITTIGTIIGQIMEID